MWFDLPFGRFFCGREGVKFMKKENVIEHTVINMDGKNFVAEVDSSGEIIKTWEVGPSTFVENGIIYIANQMIDLNGK